MLTTKYLLIWALLMPIIIQGQSNAPELIISKLSSGKEKHYEEGKRLKVVMKDGHIFKGKLTIEEGQLLIDEHRINLDNVEMIRTKSLASSIGGTGLTTLGAFCTGAGLIVIIESLNTEDQCSRGAGLLVAVPIVIGSAFVLASGVAMLTLGKKHDRKKWDFSLSTANEEMLEIGLHRAF